MKSNSWVALARVGILSAFAASLVVVNGGCSDQSDVTHKGASSPQDSRLAQGLENAPQEVKGFRSWNKANDRPLKMDPGLSLLCIGPSPQEREALSIEEHGNKFFTVFINDVGWDRFENRSQGPFPVRTVIVKQKHEGPDPESSELLTVMIKREPGFAPEIGDWEFFVLDGMAEKTTLRGTPDSCVSCHSSRDYNDYVFGYYDLPYFKEDNNSSITVAPSLRR